MAYRVDSLRCEGSDAIGAKRTCRERRERVDLTKMTQLRHGWPVLLCCTTATLLKDLPSSLVQLRNAVWTGDTRDTRAAADLGYLVNKSALRDAESPPECRVEPVQSHSQMRDSNMRRREFIRLIGGSRSRVPTAPESDDFRLREKSMNTGLRLICCG